MLKKTKKNKNDGSIYNKKKEETQNNYNKNKMKTTNINDNINENECEMIGFIRFNHLFRGNTHKKEKQIANELNGYNGIKIIFYGKPGIICLTAKPHGLSFFQKKNLCFCFCFCLQFSFFFLVCLFIHVAYKF